MRRRSELEAAKEFLDTDDEVESTGTPELTEQAKQAVEFFSDEARELR
jgi:hypothetical protein